MDDQKAFEIIEHQAHKPKPLPTLSKQVDGFTRNDVVKAFQRAFLQIGGVQRLALWANHNPTEFYRLYAKMMPSTSINIGDNSHVTIVHAIPRTPLDDHPETVDG